MRFAAALLLLCGTLGADVVVLKDGQKVGGRVADKGAHVEVTTETGLRTFLKEEVEKILKEPKELLGDSDKLLEEAKADFQRAVDGGATPDNATIRGIIAKVTQARETVAAVRELFTDDKYSDLDKKLMDIMQLMRLCRDRLGSEIARRPALIGPSTSARPAVSLDQAMGTLLDPAKRGDPAQRQAARDSFQALRGLHPEIYELATAAMVFLSRSDAEWRLEGAVLKGLQDYFAKAWLKEPLKLTAANHQEAAKWVSEQVTAIRKADAKAYVDVLTIFGIGHLAHSPAGPETDAQARAFGLVVQNGIAGTAEGHVVRDLNGWIANGDFDLAVLAFVKQHRGTDTAIVRFVWSYSLLRLVQARKRGFERPVAALDTVKAPETAFRDHVAALTKSIKAVACCSTCSGEGKLRCTNCHGKKEIRTDCAKCKGKGKIPDPGYSTGGAGGGLGQVYEIPCYPCRGRGFEKLLKCGKCKEGFNDCKQCEAPKAPPELDQIFTATPCAPCEGRGWVFRKVLWACRSCMGLGQKLVPAAEPAKVLP